MKAKKTIKLYRVLINGKPAAVSYDFDEKGVAVRADHATQPAIFDREFMASRLVQRTLDARDRVIRSLIPDFKAFAPIMHTLPFEVQPFDAEEENAPAVVRAK